MIARRGLKHMRRQPEALSDATIQPIMFVLLFAFVFGGAIDVPGGGSYKEFLMGGIFAQTIVFGCFGVAMALAYDRTNGAIDRFHSLPIPRATVLGGHAVASLIRVAAADRASCRSPGSSIGWRIHSASLDALAGYALMIVFSFAMIWIGVLLAASSATPEGVQGVAFVVIFPITFIAEHVRADEHAARACCRRSPSGTRRRRWPTRCATCSATPAARLPHDAVLAARAPGRLHAASGPSAIVLVCAPLAVGLYQRSIRT